MHLMLNVQITHLTTNNTYSKFIIPQLEMHTNVLRLTEIVYWLLTTDIFIFISIEFGSENGFVSAALN